MYLAAGFAGKPVGDELLEVVADFDPHLPVVDGQQDQQPVVLAALADAAAAVLEHLDRVLADVGVRLERLHRGHDDDVAAGLLQRADQRVHLGLARRVDDVGEVVDRLRQRAAAPVPVRPVDSPHEPENDDDEHELTDVSVAPQVEHRTRAAYARQLFDGGEVLREEPRRVSGRNRRRARSSARTSATSPSASRQRARPRAWHPRAPVTMPPFRRATFRRSAAKAGAEALTRSAIACGRPPDLDEALAQVDEVALDLRFARAPQILARDRHALERIRAEDALVRAQDFAVFERKRVERSAEFLVRAG